MQSYFINFLFINFIIICYLKFTYAQSCPPSQQQLQPMKNDLKEYFETVKKFKPGTNPKDVDFVIFRVAKDLFTSKKYAPCNEPFDWNEIEKDAIYSKKECYKPADISKESVQKEFKECMQKIVPPMIVKYGGPGMEACECFSKQMLPNYAKKYKKMIKAYYDEFKTLKHRKK